MIIFDFSSHIFIILRFIEQRSFCKIGLITLLGRYLFIQPEYLVVDILIFTFIPYSFLDKYIFRIFALLIIFILCNSFSQHSGS